MFRKHYSDKQIDAILKTLIMVVDTREKANSHILEYFENKNINYVIKKLDQADYNAFIPKNLESGIPCDIYLNCYVERKANIDEICNNLSKDKRTAFQNELIRLQGSNFTLLVEDQDGYRKMIFSEYRSKYNPLALLGTLNTFKARYGFEIVYLDKALSGNWLYWHFYYQAKHLLKSGVI